MAREMACAVCGAALTELAAVCSACGARTAGTAADMPTTRGGAGLFAPRRGGGCGAVAQQSDGDVPPAESAIAAPAPASSSLAAAASPPSLLAASAPPPSFDAGSAPEPGQPAESEPAETLCWFCEHTAAVPSATARYELHRDVRRGYTVQGGRLGGRVRYQQLFVPVPRCAGCAGSHRWAHRWAMAGFWLGMLLGTVAALAIVLASKSPGVMLLGLLVYPAALYAGAKLGRLLYERRAAGRGAGRWRRGDTFPAVAAQLRQGWQSGKPFLVTK